MNFTFKKDTYKDKRGKYSRILNLHCRICNTMFETYQKDGPGNLRRLYMDRILSTKSLTNLDSKEISDISTLKCPKCNEDIATPYIYKKENRKAFKVYQDMIIKKVRKLSDK